MGHGFHGELLVITIGYYEKRGILMGPRVPIIFAKSTIDKLPQSCFPIVGSRNVAILLGTCPVLGGCGLNVEDLTSWGSMNPIFCSFSGWMSSFCGEKNICFDAASPGNFPGFVDPFDPQNRKIQVETLIAVSPTRGLENLPKVSWNLKKKGSKWMKTLEDDQRWSKAIQDSWKFLETQHGECLGFQWWPVGIVGVRMFPCRGVEGADLECKTLQKCVDQRRW